MPDGQFQGLAVHVMVSQKNMTLYVDKQEAAALAESVAQSPDLKGIIDAAALRAGRENVMRRWVEGGERSIQHVERTGRHCAQGSRDVGSA